MKKTLLCILIFFPFIAFSQGRIEECSHKTEPEWIENKPKNHIIISESAHDLESVKKKLLDKLQSKIIDTVADLTILNPSIKSFEYYKNNDNPQKNYKDYIISKISSYRYIKGLSISKIENYYWEKYYNKKSKNYYYVYHIKYLFNDADINLMMNEFNMNEKKVERTINFYENNILNIPSVELIDNSLTFLYNFKTEFPDEDKRNAAISQLITNYQNLYKSIKIDVIKNTIGSLNIRLLINDKTISYNKAPKLKSNCVDQFNQKQINNILYINFNFFNCYNDQPNWIELEYCFGDNIITKKIDIKVQ